MQLISCDRITMSCLLRSIFQEIILWGRTDATTLLDTLPQPYLVDEGSRGVSNDRVNNLYDSIVLPSFDRSKSSSKQGPVPTMKQLLLSINHSNSLSSNDPNSGIPSQEIIGLTMPGFAFALVTIASQVLIRYVRPLSTRCLLMKLIGTVIPRQGY